MSQPKISDFSGETFKKDSEVLHFSMRATTTQLLSSSEFCKLRYDTIPVKSASAKVSFYTNNYKMPNFAILLTVRPNIMIAFFTNFMHKFFILIHLLYSSTCFEHYCAHLQEDNCISTASGIVTLFR